MVGAKLSQAADPKGIIGRLNHFTEVDVIRVELGDRNCIWHLRIFTVTVRDAEGYGAKWCCSVGWWVGSWFRWWLIGRRVGSSSVVVVVVGVVAVVPGAPGVISVGSGDVGRIGWVCSWSKYDFTASGSVTWCLGAWSWVRSMTSRNHGRAASWR